MTVKPFEPSRLVARFESIPEPDVEEMTSFLLGKGVPAKPSRELLQEIHLALQELEISGRTMGWRCVERALVVMATDPSALDAAPETLYPLTARFLGLSEAEVRSNVEAAIRTVQRRCPPDILAKRFPDGITDHRVFLERLFERVFSRLGRETWNLR